MDCKDTASNNVYNICFKLKKQQKHHALLAFRQNLSANKTDIVPVCSFGVFCFTADYLISSALSVLGIYHK